MRGTADLASEYDCRKMRWIPTLVVVVALVGPGPAAAKAIDAAQLGFEAKVLGYELQAEDAVAVHIEEQFPIAARTTERDDRVVEASANELVKLAGEAHAAANVELQMEAVVRKMDRRRGAVLLADKRMVQAAEQVGLPTQLGSALTRGLTTTWDQIVVSAG
jgi:hypothetical protein